MAFLIPVRPAGGTLSLTLASEISLNIRRFRVEERISSLFAISLEAVCTDAALDFDGFVGQPATFSIHRGMEERAWTGLCRAAALVRVADDGLSTYEITVVPELWLLTQRRNHRAFQNLAEPEIATRILSEWGVDTTLCLAETYKRREYRVQYAETDHAFVCRMLEHAGVSFFFQVIDGETKLVLSDAPQRRETRVGALARKRLDAERQGTKAIAIETNALDLGPGVVVCVDNHPRPEFRRGALIEAATQEARTRENGRIR